MPTRDVIFNIIGRDGLTPAANRAATGVESAAARISRAGDKMIRAGGKLTSHLTLPILALGAASVKAATDFNASMTQIQTQAGGSARDVRVLSREVLAMKNVQQGPNELAKALYHLKSVGMSNRDAMRALRQGSDLAAVGNANLEDTVNSLAGAWRTGIKGARNFHDAVKTINAIIGSGNIHMDQLNLALGTGILPAAKTFGLTFKDVGAALALFTDEGVPADNAATRLRMSFALLAAPSKQAVKELTLLGLTTGSAHKQISAMDLLLQNAGVTTTKLGRDMRKPDGLLVAIRDLSEHLKKSGMSAVQQEALISRAFGGGRSSAAIMSMLNNVDVLGKKYRQITRLQNTYDASVKAQAATPAAQFARTRAELEKTGIVIGKDLLPLALHLAKDVEGVVQAFDHLSPAQKRVAIDAALAVAALGPLLTIGGRLVKVFSLVTRAGGYMAAPYRKSAAQMAIAAKQVELNQIGEQLAAQRSAALIEVAEAAKANAAAESAVRMAVALEGTDSVLAADSTAAAENAIEFAAAQQAKADAAVKAAAETDAAWTKATIALRTQTAAATRSAFGLQAAIGGIGIGTGIGFMTRGASTTNKVLGALGSTAAGAALGFSMGGPIGAAIGGLTGGLSDLASAFLGTGHSASAASQAAIAALAAERAEVNNLLGSLKAVQGQYGQNYRASIASALQSRGLFGPQTAFRTNYIPGTHTVGSIDKVKRAVDPSLLTNYVLGKVGIAPILKSLGYDRSMLPGSKLTREGLIDPSITKFLTSIIAERQAAGGAEVAWQKYQRALNNTIVPQKQLAQGSKALAREFRGLPRDLYDSAIAGDQFTAMTGRTNAIVRANIGYIKAQAEAQYKHGASVAAVTRNYNENIGALRRELLALHFNAQEVADIIRLLGGIPRNITTRWNIRADVLQSTASSRALNAAGGYLAGRGYQTAHPRAMGGPVWAGMPYIVGERGPELVVPRQDGTVIPNNRTAAKQRPMKISGKLTLDVGGGRTLDAIIQDAILAEADFAAGH